VALPERISLRRAEALTGLGRTALTPLMTDAGWGRSILLADVESYIGRALTDDDWDACTVKMNRAAMKEPV